jgi:hypothetical protein
MSFDWQTISALVSPLVALFGVGLSIYTRTVLQSASASSRSLLDSTQQANLKSSLPSDVSLTSKGNTVVMIGVRRSERGIDNKSRRRLNESTGWSLRLCFCIFCSRGLEHLSTPRFGEDRFTERVTLLAPLSTPNKTGWWVG